MRLHVRHERPLSRSFVVGTRRFFLHNVSERISFYFSIIAGHLNIIIESRIEEKKRIAEKLSGPGTDDLCVIVEQAWYQWRAFGETNSLEAVPDAGRV